MPRIEKLYQYVLLREIIPISGAMDCSKCALSQADSIALIDPTKNKNTDLDGTSILSANISAFINHDLAQPSRITTLLTAL